MVAVGPPSMRFETVLRSGLAIALLAHDSPGDPGARNDFASKMLQRATGLPDIVVCRRPSGRPRLAPPHLELGVSLSRRDRHVLIGFAPDCPVGVDLEIDHGAITPSLDPIRLARDHFSRDEAEVVSSHAPAAARDLFLRLWVAKEAMLKATGRGLFDGLHQPNLAMHVAELRSGMTAPATIGKHFGRIAVAVIPLTMGRWAYCAMALLAMPL